MQFENDPVRMKTALTRDNFQCVNCRRTPNQVLLRIVLTSPDEELLARPVTQCTDCVVTPLLFRLDNHPVSMEFDIAKISERKQQIDWFSEFEKAQRRKKNKWARECLGIIASDHKWSKDNVQSVLNFSAKLGKECVEEAALLTASKAIIPPDSGFNYFCGICWNWIKDR